MRRLDSRRRVNRPIEKLLQDVGPRLTSYNLLRKRFSHNQRQPGSPFVFKNGLLISSTIKG